MSIIQKIREKYAALSIAVIALSLIGFILMDALSSRSRLFEGNKNSVGEINGNSIDIAEFDTRVNEMENNYRQQGMDVNDEMRQQIIEMLWNNQVDETILKAEYKKAGITFSSIDMNDALYGDNPPPVLAQQFKDEKTGAYDANAARQFINSLRKKKADDPQRRYIEQNLIDYLISNGLRTKYSTLLAGSVFYPKWLNDKELAEENGIASISYVTVPYSIIPDTTVQVTDEDINNYIRKRKQEYKQERTRSFSYVLFDAAPSSSDSAAILNTLTVQKQAFTEAQDAAAFLNANNSAVALFDGFVLKSKMQVPNVDSIQNLPIGGVYGPYLDGGNFVLARMLEKRPMADSVKCRHILIGTKDAQSGQEIMSDSIAKRKADSIMTAVAGGANFATLATQYSTDPGSKDKGGEYEFSSQQFGNLAKPFAEFIFYNGAGSKRVVKTDFGWHYIEVLEQKKVEPAYKVAYFSKAIEPSDETISAANTTATQFASESRDASGFEKNVRKYKLTPRVAEVKPTEYSIPGIGSARRLVKWIYQNDKGAVSEPESFGNQYIVALITEVREEGLPDAKTIRPQVEAFIRNQKKAAQLISKIGNSRDLTAIATSFNTNVMRADSISFAAPFIPNVGNEAIVIGAAFNTQQQGKVSDPFAGSSGVFVIKTESLGMKPSADPGYAIRRMQKEQSTKGNLAYKSTDALRKSVKITDNRIDFY